MRMWNVPVKNMCRKHLLGEHVEMHMFVGSIKKGISLKGYMEKNLIEIHNLKKRHDELAREMIKRGYKHNSELKFKTNKKIGKVNAKENIKELSKRCKLCKF